MTAGYSTTPLADRLGFKPGMRLFIADMPDSVRDQAKLDELGLELLAAPGAGIDAAHLFATDRGTLDRQINALSQLIAPSGFIWVSWPGRTGAPDGDIDADTIRQIALSLGLIDVEQCAVDETWSGIKLVTRKGLPGAR